jgi:cysteine-rich repeat protein
MGWMRWTVVLVAIALATDAAAQGIGPAGPLCGNGLVDPEWYEECDDGNAIDGDGCSPLCATASGPFGVGYTKVAWTYYSAEFGGDRPLIVHLYYPAGLAHAGDPWARVADGIAQGTLLGIPDAPLAAGRFPVIVYSHGFGGVAEIEVLPRAQELARNGFVVVAPQHPFDTAEFFGQSVKARPQDLRVVLDRLLDPATVPELLKDHLDADRVAAEGTSLGGITATNLAVSVDARDARVKAVMALASESYVFSTALLARSRVPILLMVGDFDSYWFGPQSIRDTWARHSPPTYLVEVTDGSHATVHGWVCQEAFCRQHASVRYALAFYRRYLFDDLPGSALLEPGAEAEFGDVLFFRNLGPTVVAGGAKPTDCAVGLGVDGAVSSDGTEVVCRDGDPCDADPQPGRCGFDVRLCLNAVEPEDIACRPSDVTRVHVSGATRSTELAALQREIWNLLPTTDRRCSPSTRVEVAVPAGRRTARRRIGARAVGSAGTWDRDRFTLRCNTN